MEGISKIEVASDSLRKIKAINKSEAPPWQFQNQLREVWEIAATMEHIRFYHVYKETNCAADSLAGLGVVLLVIFMCFRPPVTNDLYSILKEDQTNKVYIHWTITIIVSSSFGLESIFVLCLQCFVKNTENNKELEYHHNRESFTERLMNIFVCFRTMHNK
ncbi:hypothetical protein FRX31_027194 [Thalictrum thalictroides]|uniref:RNase H type-1 domain-containing protein n=1 Tax=Thalictrum thalictroides TaxID=46969 RepID=A0A7J6VEU8_THATH|nr:hypothetical protein FRX31_027194 [Thalictrum thalictroides]